jgi:hypothetical protein
MHIRYRISHWPDEREALARLRMSWVIPHARRIKRMLRQLSPPPLQHPGTLLPRSWASLPSVHPSKFRPQGTWARMSPVRLYLKASMREYLTVADTPSATRKQ